MNWPGPMTYRQFSVWQDWLDEQWNSPSRSDHYVMQLNATVANMFSKNLLDMKKLVIKFVRSVSRKSEADRTLASKQFWAALAGADLRDMGVSPNSPGAGEEE